MVTKLYAQIDKLVKPEEVCPVFGRFLWRWSRDLRTDSNRRLWLPVDLFDKKPPSCDPPKCGRRMEKIAVWTLKSYCATWLYLGWTDGSMEMASRLKSIEDTDMGLKQNQIQGVVDQAYKESEALLDFIPSEIGLKEGKTVDQFAKEIGPDVRKKYHLVRKTTAGTAPMQCIDGSFSKSGCGGYVYKSTRGDAIRFGNRAGDIALEAVTWKAALSGQTKVWQDLEDAADLVRSSATNLVRYLWDT